MQCITMTQHKVTALLPKRPPLISRTKRIDKSTKGQHSVPDFWLRLLCLEALTALMSRQTLRTSASGEKERP